MNKTTNIQLLFIIFTVTLLLAQFNVSPAYACTATPQGKAPPTIADRVEFADVVLVGTVTMVTEGYEPSATVQVEQYFKGAGAEQIEIRGFGGSSICRRNVEVGERLIFYVQQRADGSLYAYWLTAGGAVTTPTDELIAEITTALTVTPILPNWDNEMLEYLCTPTPHPISGPSAIEEPFTIAHRIELSDDVLLGTVLEVYGPQQSIGAAVNVQVERYFKGAGAEQIRIDGFGGGSLCGRSVEVGDRFVFYVQNYAEGSSYFYILMSFEYAIVDTAIAPPTDTLIAEILKVVSDDTHTPLPLTPSIIPPTSSATHTPTPETVAMAPPASSATYTPTPEIVTYTPIPETVAMAPPMTELELTPETAVSPTSPIKTSNNPILAGIGTLLVLILITAVLMYRRNQKR